MSSKGSPPAGPSHLISCVWRSYRRSRAAQCRVRLGSPLQEVRELNIRVFLVELASAQFPGEDVQCGEHRGGAVVPEVMGLLQIFSETRGCTGCIREST